VLDFGADPTGVADSSASFVAANTNAKGIIVTAGLFKISVDITISTPIQFLAGASLSIDAGKVVTVNSTIDAAPEQQIFSGSGTVTGIASNWVGWFGANSGVADNTTAIQLAVTATKYQGTLNLAPTVSYPMAGTTPVICAQALTLNGNGASLTYTGTAANLLRFTATYCSAINLLCGGASTAVSGYGIDFQASYGYAYNIQTSNGYIGIRCYGGNATQLIAINDTGSAASAVWVENSVDVLLTNFYFNCGNLTKYSEGALAIRNHVDSFQAVNGVVLQGVFPLYMDATSYTGYNFPKICRFDSVTFDAYAQDAHLNNSDQLTFVNCWFSGGRTSTGYHGVNILTGNTIKFTGCQFNNCGANGVYVTAAATNVIFSGCEAISNSTTAGSGSKYGIEFAANTTDFSVQGCVCKNTTSISGAGTQGIGIAIGANCDRFIVADNLVSNNSVTNVYDGSALLNKRVANNY